MLIKWLQNARCNDKAVKLLAIYAVVLSCWIYVYFHASAIKSSVNLQFAKEILGRWFTVHLEHSTSIHGTRICIFLYSYILHNDLTEVKSLHCIFLWNLRFCSWHCIRILSRIKCIPSFTPFKKVYNSCRSLTDFLRIGRFITICRNRVLQPYLHAPPHPSTWQWCKTTCIQVHDSFFS